MELRPAVDAVFNKRVAAASMLSVAVALGLSRNTANEKPALHNKPYAEYFPNVRLVTIPGEGYEEDMCVGRMRVHQSFRFKFIPNGSKQNFKVTRFYPDPKCRDYQITQSDYKGSDIPLAPPPAETVIA